ncbi:MAG: hypothetical protein SPJ31_05530 [Oscillospiraceae bacterium]|nr:hypothetical protein [Oscillospiraceae bacterium]
MMNNKCEQISVDPERAGSFYDERAIGKKKMPPFMYVLAVISVIILASYVVFAASGKLCFEKPETDGKAESHSYEAVKQITTINHKGSVWEKETSSSEAETTLSDREHTVVRNDYGSYSSGNNSSGSTSGESTANTPTGDTEKPEDKTSEKTSTEKTEKSEDPPEVEKSTNKSKPFDWK